MSKRVSITLPMATRAVEAGDSVGNMLASFVPSCIVPQLFRDSAPASDSSHHRPAVEGIGAVVFCDISGFTALTERLAKEGPDGSEKLVAFLNNYFGTLVQMVEDSGGDVMMFAGDALLALWREDTMSDVEDKLERLGDAINDILSETGADSDQRELSRLRSVKRELQEQLIVMTEKKQMPGGLEALKAVTHKAVDCAYQMMTLMNHKEDQNQPRLHMGVGVGKISLLQVGGRDDQWAFLVAGEPLTQIGPACGAASPDYTVLSPECWELAHDICTGDQVEGTGMVRLTGMKVVPAKDPFASLPRRNFVPKVVGQLRQFIPKIIQINTTAGKKTRVAELRRITTLFINIIGIDISTSACAAEVHRVVHSVQGALYSQEGVINKIILDDKGFVILGGFGLPPTAHRNDAERGVVAACLVKRDLNAIGVECSVGITTGHAFCGIVGSEQRREYTMMGDPINTAARLMTATKDSVLCDRNTVASATASTKRLRFRQLKSRKFKGKAFYTDVFEPYLDTAFVKKRIHRDGVSFRGLVDRSKELFKLSDLVHDFATTRKAGTMIIEGDTGLGRTRLLEETLLFASHAGLQAFQCCGDAAFKKVPFYPWRPVLEQLFGIGPETSDLAHERARKEKLLAQLARNPLTENYGPLLSIALGITLEPNKHTELLQGKMIFTRLTELLIFVIMEAAVRTPTVIMVDDFHEFDKSSREMMLKMTTAGVLMIVGAKTTREGAARTALDQLAEDPDTSHITLKPLSRQGVTKVFCKCLGLESLPSSFTDVILDKCGGNPYLVKEMAFSCLETGLVTVEPGKAELKATYAEFNALLPGTLETSIMSEFDKLTSSTPSQIIILKVASAIGFEFQVSMLIDIFPQQINSQEEFQKEVAQDLEELERKELIHKAGGGTDMMDVEGKSAELATTYYRFANAIVQQVAYRLMLFKERTKLHRSSAAWYEAHTQVDEYGAHTLAHHWSLGDHAAKAVHYYELGGTAAIARHLLEEARLTLLEAEKECTKLTEQNPLTSATLKRKLAEVAFALGEERRAETYALEAARLLGCDGQGIIPVLLRNLIAAERAHPNSEEESRQELRAVEIKLRPEAFQGNTSGQRAWTRTKVNRWNSGGRQATPTLLPKVILEKEDPEVKKESKELQVAVKKESKFWHRRKLSSTLAELGGPSKRPMTDYEKAERTRFLFSRRTQISREKELEAVSASAYLKIRAPAQVDVHPNPLPADARIKPKKTPPPRAAKPTSAVRSATPPPSTPTTFPAASTPPAQHVASSPVVEPTLARSTPQDTAAAAPLAAPLADDDDDEADGDPPPSSCRSAPLGEAEGGVPVANDTPAGTVAASPATVPAPAAAPAPATVDAPGTGAAPAPTPAHVPVHVPVPVPAGTPPATGALGIDDGTSEASEGSVEPKKKKPKPKPGPKPASMRKPSTPSDLSNTSTASTATTTTTQGERELQYAASLARRASIQSAHSVQSAQSIEAKDDSVVPVEDIPEELETEDDSIVPVEDLPEEPETELAASLVSIPETEGAASKNTELTSAEEDLMGMLADLDDFPANNPMSVSAPSEAFYTNSLELPSPSPNLARRKSETPPIPQKPAHMKRKSSIS